MTQFAFVFPGQGSQTVGMLADMAASYPIVEETFAEASAALGYDLWALTQQGPAEELNKTWQTQPALLTASVALYRVWQQQGGKAPAMMAGHSLGEYSALVCAGVIDFADAVRLVEMRGMKKRWRCRLKKSSLNVSVRNNLRWQPLPCRMCRLRQRQLNLPRLL